MRRLAVAAALALVLTSCASLGREFPRCDFPFIDIPISIIMQLQATPDAAVGVCLNDLEPGWTYHHMRHETGRSVFWLDSDRLGDRFVEVELGESCDPGSAAARPHPNADVMRFVDATEETSPVDVVVVPTVDSVVDYAASVGVDLSDVTANGRRLQLELARAGDAESAIAAARAAGAFAIEVDVRNAVRGTVSLAVPNDEDLVEDLTLVEAVGAIEDRVEEGTYAATWYHPFEGGCITFEFDADGPGVESLVADAERAIGFVDLADLKRQAAEAGFILDEAELE